MKRVAVYSRVSTYEQNPQAQILDLRQMAAQRGFEIVHEYSDRISGTKARRPGLDALMSDARRGRFDVVLVWTWIARRFFLIAGAGRVSARSPRPTASPGPPSTACFTPNPHRRRSRD